MSVSDGVGLSPTKHGQLFEERGYVVIRQLLPRILCDYIAELVKVLEGRSGLDYNDQQVEKAFSAASPVVSETLLDVMTPVLSQMINCELYPTYSYLRVYMKGAELERHTDRPSCEVSVTLPISCDASGSWPLYVEAGGEGTRVDLEPGDVLLYKGIEIPHWREAYEGERQVQVFLHYVRKDGEYGEYKFDKRPSLSHQNPEQGY